MENNGHMDEQMDNSFLKMEMVDKILFIQKELDIPLNRLAQKIYICLQEEDEKESKNNEDGEGEKKYVESLIKCIQRSKHNQNNTHTKTLPKTLHRLQYALKLLLRLPEVRKLNLPPDYSDWEDRDNAEFIRELCEEYFNLLDKKVVASPNSRFVDNLNNIIQAANNGHIQAQTAIGEFYFNGGNLNIPNFSLAFDYFARAANQNCPRALWKLGLMQEDNDLGISPNMQLAFRYFKLSADQNFPMALNRVACCYGNGRGTERNDELFFEYAKKSADLGDEIGELSVAYAYSIGKGVEQNLEQAAKIYIEKLSSLKTQYLLHCQARLAHIYLNGLGVEQSDEGANFMYGILKNIFDKHNVGYENDEMAFKWFLQRNLDASPYTLLHQFKKNLKAELFGQKTIFDERSLPRYSMPDDEYDIWYN